MHSTVQSCCNINAVFKVFTPCIAGCSHPLGTCIECLDKQSPAFHAVGFGKGSHRSAVVITSFDTAVFRSSSSSVKLSAGSVHAASCDCCGGQSRFCATFSTQADGHLELQDTGSSQAINQLRDPLSSTLFWVNHFGSFVRLFFSLPPSADHILAGMVLTQVDSAVHLAISSP
ncbi:hypothetical protein RJ641_030754 [Dillenia turbinata]|uniref:Uncharacterized protein n=1 Tax=Dillenia turbinata TaxID=194707 RepID=A0AAN8ZGK6_9MAGN